MRTSAAYGLAFLSSFCILLIEIVAGRILAPFLGVSLYTWTSIIGVILTGLSIGSFLGGRLGDAYPSVKTLGWLLLLSGAFVLFTAPLTNLVAPAQFNAPLMVRILAVTTAIFLVPSCLLGMILPVIVRVTMRSVDQAGVFVGRIYALSAAGSVAGAFSAGFLLISWVGTRNIILMAGSLLLCAAILPGTLLRTMKPALAALLLPSVLLWWAYERAFTPLLHEDTSFYRESDYFTIRVIDVTRPDGLPPVKALVLDNLLHSYVNPFDPLDLEYAYEKAYRVVFDWKYRPDRPLATLTIGGGGYTFPRYIEKKYPRAFVDVVEIDPEVTRTVYDCLGLSRGTRIRTFNVDGRWYVRNCGALYDAIFVDVFNDLSLPYHLTTREFALQLRRVLKPDGIVISNVVDNFREGLFLPSYLKTMESVFGRGSVALLAVSTQYKDAGTGTFIVLAGRRPVDMAGLETHLGATVRDRTLVSVVPAGVTERMIAGRPSVVLTDDHAPVDNLIAPVFEERFGYRRK
jgi:predicted membrane-bound spermidine synthase